MNLVSSPWNHNDSLDNSHANIAAIKRRPFHIFWLEISTQLDSGAEGEPINIAYLMTLNITLIIRSGQSDKMVQSQCQIENVILRLSNFSPRLYLTSLHLPGNNIERMIGSPFVEREREREREGERETHTTQLRLVPLIWSDRKLATRWNWK